MIRYSLQCGRAHGFEAWFSSGDDFERQSQTGLLSCPLCDSREVSKGVMAPAVATSDRRTELRPDGETEIPSAIAARVREMVKSVRSSAEDVGERFPEEARRIHYGETEARGIIGQASRDDVHALVEEGIAVLPLPVIPEDAN